MMKNKLVLTLTSVGLAFGTFFLVRQLQWKAAAYAGPNYVATFVERQFDPSTGKEIQSENTLRAASDQGTVEVLQRKSPVGDLVEIRKIVFFNAAKRVVLNPMTESLTTYKLPAREVNAYRAAKAKCTDDFNPPTEIILGYMTQRHVYPLPDHAWSVPMVWEEWRAPALNCLALRSRITVKATGIVANSSEVAFVLLGEPPANLFEVPQNYTERSPSEVFAEFARRFPGQPASEARSSQVLDEAYRQRQ
jgi:hypothetical protein